MTHIAGSDSVIHLRTIDAEGATLSKRVILAGPLEDLRDLQSDPSEYVPTNYTLESTEVSPTGDGMGEMILNCIRYGGSSSTDVFGTTPDRVTYRIEMAEVPTDLKSHPDVNTNATDLSVINAYLATDPAKRGTKTEPKWVDADGNEHTITTAANPGAMKFIAAYLHGIESYNRYFPIIEKISTYKHLPGLLTDTTDKKKITGGTATFSNDVGKWSEPDIALAGYAQSNWFKSKDSWAPQGNHSWQRTEQWTWTPDKSTDTSWIYGTANNNNQ